MAVEVEARFRADGRAPLDHLARASRLGPAVLGPAATALEEDRYLDTADGRLAAVAWACRLRTRGSRVVASLKGPADAPTEGWLHRRPEVEGPATASPDPRDWPPSAARDLVLELSGGSPLVERVRLRQERTERTVTIGGRDVGGLTLDVVSVERDGIAVGEMHLVELELSAGSDGERDLDRLAESLLAVGGLEPEPRTKLEIALEGERA